MNKSNDFSSTDFLVILQGDYSNRATQNKVNQSEH